MWPPFFSGPSLHDTQKHKCMHAQQKQPSNTGTVLARFIRASGTNTVTQSRLSPSLHRLSSASSVKEPLVSTARSPPKRRAFGT